MSDLKQIYLDATGGGEAGHLRGLMAVREAALHEAAQIAERHGDGPIAGLDAQMIAAAIRSATTEKENTNG